MGPASRHVTGSHAGHDGPHFKGVRAQPGNAVAASHSTRASRERRMV
jgi:hypothetical protein